jgi:hypothetical protein
MEQGYKNKIVFTIAVILIITGCSAGLYLLNRSLNVNNNDLLLSFETLKPISVSEEKFRNFTYKTYFFGKDVGSVTVEDGRLLVIEDKKHGFIKEYRYGVLYYEYDVKKAELLSYFDQKFWLGGGRTVGKNCDKFLRTLDECQYIGRLLEEKKYDQISTDNKNQLIITYNGINFVN